MVRRYFIKSLDIDGDEKMTILDYIYDFIFYNKVSIFLRKLGRFILRLPSYIKLCWSNETWDYEGFYDFVEMYLKQLRKAQEKDTWHEEHGRKRAIQQIDLTLAHLDRFRNWPNYYEWPEPIHKQLPDGFWTIEYKKEDKSKIEYVHKMEEKHFNAFWRLLKKYLSNWWT